MRSLASGELRAKTTSDPQPSSSWSWALVMASRSVPLTTRSPPAPMSTLRAIAAAVSPLSPVTNAGVVGPLDGCGDLRARRVQHGREPDQAQLAFGILTAARHARCDGQRAVGKGEHPQAAPSVAVHGARGLFAVGRRDRAFLPAAADRGAEGENLFGRPLDVRYQAAVQLVDGGHELELWIETEQLAAVLLPRGH